MILPKEQMLEIFFGQHGGVLYTLNIFSCVAHEKIFTEYELISLLSCKLKKHFQMWKNMT